MAKYIGYTPEEWQKPVHKAIGEHPTASTFVVLAPRQTGKTMLITNELLRASINNRNAVSLCISITLDGSRKIYRDIVKATENSGIIKKKNDSLLTLEFITGSIIYFRSGEQRDTLRGLTIKNGGLLVVDESAYQSDDFFFSVLLPMTNVYRSPILLTSTPRFKTGFFYTFYEKGKNGDPGVYSFNFTDFDLSKYLPEDMLIQYKQVMPKNQFISEYLGQFLDGDSLLFENYKDRILPPGTTTRVYIGIDWASGTGQDRTAISVINQSGEQIFTASFNDKNTTQTVDYIEELVRRYKIYNPVIWAEVNGLGKPYCDLLKDRKIKVTEWTTSNQSKNELVAHLQVAFEQEKISILGDERQIDELGYYEADYNPKTRVVTYNAPRGLNDDTVVALMISWEAYLASNKVGKYSVGAV
ncbi:MAG: terminase family protein [Lachnospiraceae bacterium]|nr:terminase family protein [Lachnospiraceae bacterium]